MAAFVVFLTGCQSAAIAKRRSQRLEAYNALTPEARVLVDKGEIDAGMDTNAVFVAWGRPTEVLKVESPGEPELVWFYYRRFTREHPRWVRRSDRYDYYGSYDYRPVMTSHSYLAKTVGFKEGRVVRWQNFPQPWY